MCDCKPRVRHPCLYSNLARYVYVLCRPHRDLQPPPAVACYYSQRVAFTCGSVHLRVHSTHCFHLWKCGSPSSIDVLLPPVGARISEPFAHLVLITSELFVPLVLFTSELFVPLVLFHFRAFGSSSDDRRPPLALQAPCTWAPPPCRQRSQSAAYRCTLEYGALDLRRRRAPVDRQGPLRPTTGRIRRYPLHETRSLSIRPASPLLSP